MKSPAQVAELWRSGMANAGPKIKAGVDAMTVNPMEEAAKQVDRYQKGVQQAAQDGTWVAGLLAADPRQWKDKMKGTGVDRIAGGAKDAVPAQTRFFGELLPVTEDIKNTARTMDKGTKEAALARVGMAYDKMQELRARRRGR